MAISKQTSKVRLSADDLHSVRAHVINAKLQHRAILYANISYAKFRNIIDHGSGMTKREHARLMEFCKSAKSSKQDF